LIDPTYHPKWHLDPISHFATVHFLDTDRHTHTERLTDGIGDRSIPIMLTLY